MTRRTRQGFILSSVLLVACGDNQKQGGGVDGGGVDAEAPAMIDGCASYAGLPVSSTAWVKLGTGYDSFESMPEALPLEYGMQAGFDLVANVMMSGFEPGTNDFLDPKQPHTRIVAYFAATGVPLKNPQKRNCGYRAGYVRSPDGNYVLSEGEGVVFETCWRAQHLIGKQVRIDVEVLDYYGVYAKDSVTVTMAAPLGDYPSNEPPMPGCGDYQTHFGAPLVGE